MFPVEDLVAAMPKHQRRDAKRYLGVSGTRWTEYERDGLTLRRADELAVRAGLHPAEVWTHWYDADLLELVGA